MVIDINKKYRTRSGRKVKIDSIDSGERRSYPVCGRIRGYWTDSNWWPESWSIEGECVIGHPSENDLVEDYGVNFLKWLVEFILG